MNWGIQNLLSRIEINTANSSSYLTVPDAFIMGSLVSCHDRTPDLLTVVRVRSD